MSIPKLAVPTESTPVTPRQALDTLLEHLNSGPSGYPFANFRILAKDAEIDGLLQASAMPGVVRNHIANMLNGAACSTDSSSPDAVLLRRLELHIVASSANAAAFRASVDDDLVPGFFYDLEDESFTDFDHFDATLARVVALLGKTSDAADAVGGLDPAEYWALVVTAAEPKFDDNNLPIWLSSSKPAFWAACLERALDTGMTADSWVDKQGAWPDHHPKAERETFRDCIEGRAGAGCAAMFDAVACRRAMSARVDSKTTGGSPMQNAQRRTRLAI